MITKNSPDIPPALGERVSVILLRFLGQEISGLKLSDIRLSWKFGGDLMDVFIRGRLAGTVDLTERSGYRQAMEHPEQLGDAMNLFSNGLAGWLLKAVRSSERWCDVTEPPV